MAQVDASIGGKTGINSNQGKNLIGTFYQPDFVLNDPIVLKSLPQREIVSGYAEILKHSLILDKKFFIWLSKNGKKIILDRSKKFLVNAIFKKRPKTQTLFIKNRKERIKNVFLFIPIYSRTKK